MHVITNTTAAILCEVVGVGICGACYKCSFHSGVEWGEGEG